ncbi:capsular biosynthesis protein, partial [Bacillus wiedmannii]
MTILWMNLAIVFMLAFFARYFAIPVTNSLTLIKPNRLLIIMAALSLVLVAGLRNNIGDTYFYMHAYKITEFNWEYVQTNKDMG